MARTVNDLYSQFFSAPYIARLQMQVQRLPKVGYQFMLPFYYYY